MWSISVICTRTKNILRGERTEVRCHPLERIGATIEAADAIEIEREHAARGEMRWKHDRGRRGEGASTHLRRESQNTHIHFYCMLYLTLTIVH